jgi:hypothetical protein
MRSSTPKIAFGFSPHTGWAQAVVVAGSLSTPKLLHRGRIDLGVGGESVHVFHTAAEMTFARAQGYIERCAKTATNNAHQAIASLLSAHGQNAAVGVVVGNAKLPPLEAVLRSHMLIHAAEGDFYRRAILNAAEGHGLASAAVPGKELQDAAGAVLNAPGTKLQTWLASYGKTVGRPWGRDEKDAVLAACVALYTKKPSRARQRDHCSNR